jgi:hypothetical protein
VIFNDKVLVPIYHTARDDEALQIYEAVMPGYEIVGIDAEDLIESLGSIHCICREIHRENPLMVLHEPVLEASGGDTPILRCRLNPRFPDCEVELNHTAGVGAGAESILAVLAGGIWRAQMPPVHQSFDYWFVARAYTGEGVFETVLPEGAPLEVFTCHVDEPTAVDIDVEVASGLTMWPNPSRGASRVGFTIPRRMPVSAAIHDASGRIVRRLLGAAPRPAGWNEVGWRGDDDTGRDVPGGTYFLRMQVGEAQRSSRVVLVR